jgi:aryl-alcohol dehydrogenase-like predicted oxidoreductase
MLGKTGEKVTAFGLGGHHVGKARDEKIAEALIERAIERGVRFFDNAADYQKGLSETYYGRFLTPKYRDHVFITTKSSQPTADGVRKDSESSLKRLKTDHVDLWQLHAFTSVDDVKKRIANGVVEVFLEMREQKKARLIGFTGHSSQEAHCFFLDHCKTKAYQMDTCLMPINLVDPHYDSFVINVLPKLIEQGVAPLAMKTMVFGKIFKRAEELEPGVNLSFTKERFDMRLFLAAVILLCRATAETAMFPEGSEWETVSKGHRIVEGIAVAPDGTVYLTDVTDGELFKLEPSGLEKLHDGKTAKANGLAFGPDGRLYAACMGKPAITAWDLNAGTRSEIPLPAPANDLAVTSSGSLYCTWGPANAIYHLSVADPQAIKVAEVKNPNGITLSHGGGELWVGEFTGDTVVAFPILLPNPSQPHIAPTLPAWSRTPKAYAGFMPRMKRP